MILYIEMVHFITFAPDNRLLYIDIIFTVSNEKERLYNLTYIALSIDFLNFVKIFKISLSFMQLLQILNILSTYLVFRSHSFHYYKQ